MRMTIRASRDIMVTRNIMDIMRTTARRAVTLMANTGATAVATGAVAEADMDTIKATCQRHSYIMTFSATEFLVSVLEVTSFRGVTVYVAVLATLHFTFLWTK
jgi:hypothetical protein